MGCWEQLRNVPHTSTNILCALRPALEPPSPHPSSWHLLQGLLPGAGWGRELGGSGLTVPVPERVQLATPQACLVSTGGSRGGACSLLIQFVYTNLCSSLAPKRRPECMLCWGAHSHTCGGYPGVNRWAALYKPPYHASFLRPCLPTSPSLISSSSSVYSIPDRSVPDVSTQPDLEILSVLLPPGPQFPYLSYGGSTIALSWVPPHAGCCTLKPQQGWRSISIPGSCCYQ